MAIQEVVFDHQDHPKSPGVGIPQLGLVVQVEHDVFMRAARAPGAANPELPGHAEVNQNGSAGVGFEQEVFAPAPDGCEGGSPEVFQVLRNHRFPQPFLPHQYTADPPS